MLKVSFKWLRYDIYNANSNLPASCSNIASREIFLRLPIRETSKFKSEIPFEISYEYFKGYNFKK
jgi:hypothetical protein